MTSKTDQLSNVAFIGIGGCGVNMLESWLTKLSRDVLCVALDRDEKHFCRKDKFKEKLILSNIKCIGSTFEYSKSAQAEVQISIDKQMPILLDLLRDKKRVVILSGLGGVIGTWASQYICNQFISMDKHVVTMLVMPFGFEGESRLKVADYALLGFDGAAHRVLCFNDYLIKHSPKNTSMSDAFELMNEKAFELLTIPN